MLASGVQSSHKGGIFLVVVQGSIGLYIPGHTVVDPSIKKIKVVLFLHSLSGRICKSEPEGAPELTANLTQIGLEAAHKPIIAETLHENQR